MKYTVVCQTVEETQRFGRALGAKLRGGEVVQLIGDVGAGKTTFVRALVEGTGSTDHVSSPTFTICNTYNGRLTIHHCDFYRLHEDSLIENELDELVDGQSVVVLEWAENIRTIRSIESVAISIRLLDGEARSFEVSVPDTYNYLTL